MARPLHTPTPNASGHHRPSRSASRAPSRPDCSFCLRDQVITSRRPLARGVWRHARMGRARVGGDEMEKVNMADVLQLLLPRPGNIGAQVGHGMGRARVFKCKTCNRSFPTFQALGGHSTSHRKPKPPGGVPSNAKPKMHECSICGLEFAMGQALGGHMRRHRGELEATSSQRRCVEKPSHLDDGSVCLDLNQLPPMDEEEVVDVDDDDDVELLTLGLGIQLGQKVPLQVGCMGCSAITY